MPIAALAMLGLAVAGCTSGAAVGAPSLGASASNAQVQWNAQVEVPISKRLIADLETLKPYLDGTGLTGVQLMAAGERGRADCADAAVAAAAPDPAVRSVWDSVADECTTLFDDVSDIGAITLAKSDPGALPSQARTAWNTLDGLLARIGRQARV